MADKNIDNPGDQMSSEPKRTKKPEPFRTWAVKRYGKQESERGQLARKIEADPDFPDSMDRNQLALYIYKKGMLPRESMPIYNYMYNQYRKHVLDKADPSLVPARTGPGLATPSLERHCTATNAEVSQIIKNSLYWYTRPLVQTAAECADRLNEFFARMVETGEIPTVEKMALALGTYTAMMRDWETGKGNVDPEMGLMIKKAKQILAAMDAELVSTGKIPVVSYIFRAKNFFGMRDQQEVLQVNYDAGTNPADLARMYGEIGQGEADTIDADLLD